MAKLSEELNIWFAHAAYTDESGRRREPSTAEVAAAISEDPRHDVTISRSYLTSLRNGTQTNPTLSVLEALVAHFRRLLTPLGIDVSINDLTDDSSNNRATNVGDLLADRQIQKIALRAGTMTPALREQILKMMDILDPPPETAPAADE
ncbi:hypothetical protein LZ318_32000 [Saccharopolyspora indica]|uniref:hypothetical protein n=1 Tax=Saccharopolyspora indica TaxID=1229659 RepID=UPI0022EA77AF|nr:hypothetical protein [Saccharopolyspora indica]MDA3644138.1 hypothetical protein [Saccharopolyspora indica]